LAAPITIPAEHASHEASIHVQATLIAFSTALVGFVLATVFYGWRKLDPRDVRNQFGGLYRFLRNKWWFDELYNALFVQPVYALARLAAWLDKYVLDRIIDGSAAVVRGIARIGDAIDRFGVDWMVNVMGNTMHSLGLSLRALQTGKLRQYAMFVIVGTVALFILISLFRGITAAGG
jgi:NADH-quinone oxidoreductase subunit L